VKNLYGTGTVSIRVGRQKDSVFHAKNEVQKETGDQNEG
jgi:hypothetical protein